MDFCYAVVVVCDRNFISISFWATREEAENEANRLLLQELIESGYDDPVVGEDYDDYYGWCGNGSSCAWISDGSDWDAYVVGVPIDSCPDIVLNELNTLV